MAWTLAPAEDVPVISAGHALGGGAAPTISPSAGWHREKRTGFAEPAVGATPATSVNTGLDLAGSSRFGYPALPAGDPLASFPSGYVVSTLKPGGSAQFAYWPFDVEFETASPVVELRLQAPVAAPCLGRILVDGRPIADAAHYLSGRTAGSGYGVTLTWATSRLRRITIYGLNNGVGRFGGLAVQTGYTVTRPIRTVATRLAVIGDSFVNGAGSSVATNGGANNVETFAVRTALALGMDEVILAGIGGTGYTAGAAGERFIDRVAAVMALGPTHVLLAGGRNDSAAGEQEAAEAVLDAIGPGVVRWMTHTCSSTQAAVITALTAAAASRGVPFVSLDIDALPKIPGDGVHPTFPGHVQMGDALAAALAPADEPGQGAAAGATSWAGQAAGRRRALAHGDGAASWSGAASGARRPVAAAAGAHAWASTAHGATPGVEERTGTATGAFAWTGTATGRRRPRATATGAAVFAGVAVGRRRPTAAAAGSTTWTSAATAGGRERPPGRLTLTLTVPVRTLAVEVS